MVSFTKDMRREVSNSSSAVTPKISCECGGKRSAQAERPRREDGSPSGQDAALAGGLVYDSRPRQGRAPKKSLQFLTDSLLHTDQKT
jgi:hypothetical protein